VLPRRRVPVDLFICTPENWGYIFMLRTGCAEFSRAVVTYAPKMGMRFEDGRLWRGKMPIETREEMDVFRLLGLPYVEPHHRVGNTLFSRGRRDILDEELDERVEETLRGAQR